MVPMSQYYSDLLTPQFANQKVIIAIASVADSAGWVDMLKQLNVAKIFILAPSLGAGTAPQQGNVEYCVLHSDAKDALESFRRFGANLANLSQDARDALDRFDPERTALVIANTQFSVSEVGGRKTLFSRPQAWSDIEDKTKIDALWKKLGITHSPCEVVPVDEVQLRRAHNRIKSADGAVWSGDSREGFNGGSCYVRQVNNDAQFKAAFEFFSQRCDSVRMMPFLSGVPCSMHGLVFPDRVVVGRVVEQLVFLRPELGTFHYAGVSTTWDPASHHVEQMHQVVKATGEHLREIANYGGAFSLDGMLTEQGFFPTEINTRFSAGIIMQCLGMPETPLAMVDYLLRTGSPLDFNSEELERQFLQSGELNRKVAGWSLTSRRISAIQNLSLKATLSSFEKCGDHEEADATVTLGPSDVGGMVRISFSEQYVGKGEIAGPSIRAVLAYLDSQGITAFGRLVETYASGGSGTMAARRLVS